MYKERRHEWVSWKCIKFNGTVSYYYETNYNVFSQNVKFITQSEHLE